MTIGQSLKNLGDGMLTFENTESWRLIYEQILRSSLVYSYKSVAWVKMSCTGKMSLGKSIRLNQELVSRQQISMERIFILQDELWPPSSEDVDSKSLECSRRTRDPESKCLSFENHPFAMIRTCSQTLVSTVRTRLATKLWMVSSEPIALRFNSISMRSLSRNYVGSDCLPTQNLLTKYSDVLLDLSNRGLKNVMTSCHKKPSTSTTHGSVCFRPKARKLHQRFLELVADAPSSRNVWNFLLHGSESLSSTFAQSRVEGMARRRPFSRSNCEIDICETQRHATFILLVVRVV